MKQWSFSISELNYACIPQLRVRAFDDGVPPRENITTVAISVNRNLNCPRWRQGSITVNIMETHDITSSVARVEATDSDPQVFKWIINLFRAMSGECYFGVSNLDYILTLYIHFAF